MKTRIHTNLLWPILVTMLMSVASLAAQNNSDQQKWIQLFNGKNLDGWRVKITGHDLDDNFANTFRVEDGLLKVVYDGYDSFNGQFGHIFYDKKFSCYIVAAEYRFVGEQVAGAPEWGLRNNGIMVHSQSPESMLKDQNFPISIEVELVGGTGSGKQTTANVCTPGTNIVMDGKLITKHCVNSTSKTYNGDQWVRVEVVVLGDKKIKHIVNGETVLSYEKPQIGGDGVVENYDPKVKQDGKLLKSGYIALQSESHPTEFRKVELLPLPDCVDPTATK